jgi:hypothetical protein
VRIEALVSDKERDNNIALEPNVASKPADIVRLSAFVMAALFPGAEDAAAASLYISSCSSIQFGGVIPCTAGTGKITINPQLNTRVLSGCLEASGATWSRGSCVFSQSPAFQDISVTLTPDTNLVAGTKTMKVPTYEYSHIVNASSVTFKAAHTFTATSSWTSSGVMTLYIGATLTVGANQTAGVYKGTMTITGTLK